VHAFLETVERFRRGDLPDVDVLAVCTSYRRRVDVVPEIASYLAQAALDVNGQAASINGDQPLARPSFLYVHDFVQNEAVHRFDESNLSELFAALRAARARLPGRTRRRVSIQSASPMHLQLPGTPTAAADHEVDGPVMDDLAGAETSSAPPTPTAVDVSLGLPPKPQSPRAHAIADAVQAATAADKYIVVAPSPGPEAGAADKYIVVAPSPGPEAGAASAVRAGSRRVLLSVVACGRSAFMGSVTEAATKAGADVATTL
jgi:hypothetical protein